MKKRDVFRIGVLTLMCTFTFGCNDNDAQEAGTDSEPKTGESHPLEGTVYPFKDQGDTIEWCFGPELSLESSDACTDCVTPVCRFFAVFVFPQDDIQSDTCPDGFPPEPVHSELISDPLGSSNTVKIFCQLPVIPAERECSDAMARYTDDTETLGLYYCENYESEGQGTCDRLISVTPPTSSLLTQTHPYDTFIVCN